MRPFHQTVGPALPFVSKSVGPCAPRYQSRSFQPIVVGSSVGSSAADGSGAASARRRPRARSRSRGRGRRPCAARRRAQPASRAPSSPSTSGCRSRSQGRTRRASAAAGSAWATPTSTSSIGPPSQSSVVTHRNCGLIQEPRGRPRIRRPSIAICEQDARRRSAPPPSGPSRSAAFSRAAASATTSVVIASPRAATAAAAALPARVIQAPGRVETPLSRTKPSSRFRWGRRHGPCRGREDDRHDLARDRPERPPHREHAHEAPLLVQRALDVGRGRSRRSEPGSRGRR